VSERGVVRLEMVEYVAGEVTFETEYGDASLVLPLHKWDELGRPGNVRIVVEPDQ
jgi:hypothetical protein